MVYPQPFYNDMETTNLPEHRDCYYLALDHLPGFCKRSSRNGPQNGRHPTPVAAAKFNIEILRNEQ